MNTKHILPYTAKECQGKSKISLYKTKDPFFNYGEDCLCNFCLLFRFSSDSIYRSSTRGRRIRKGRRKIPSALNGKSYNCLRPGNHGCCGKYLPSAYVTAISPFSVKMPQYVPVKVIVCVISVQRRAALPRPSSRNFPFDS